MLNAKLITSAPATKAITPASPVAAAAIPAAAAISRFAPSSLALAQLPPPNREARAVGLEFCGLGEVQLW
jgi:hypothetical protein